MIRIASLRLAEAGGAGARGRAAELHHHTLAGRDLRVCVQAPAWKGATESVTAAATVVSTALLSGDAVRSLAAGRRATATSPPSATRRQAQPHARVMSTCKARPMRVYTAGRIDLRTAVPMDRPRWPSFCRRITRPTGATTRSIARSTSRFATQTVHARVCCRWRAAVRPSTRTCTAHGTLETLQ